MFDVSKLNMNNIGHTMVKAKTGLTGIANQAMGMSKKISRQMKGTLGPQSESFTQLSWDDEDFMAAPTIIGELEKRGDRYGFWNLYLVSLQGHTLFYQRLKSSRTSSNKGKKTMSQKMYGGALGMGGQCGWGGARAVATFDEDSGPSSSPKGSPSRLQYALPHSPSRRPMVVDSMCSPSRRPRIDSMDDEEDMQQLEDDDEDGRGGEQPPSMRAIHTMAAESNYACKKIAIGNLVSARIMKGAGKWKHATLMLAMKIPAEYQKKGRSAGPDSDMRVFNFRYARACPHTPPS
jgi:hypothetical protein